MDPIISCRGLTKTYRQGAVEVAALRGVDLDIAPGDFATLSGPSGSGKTTLLSLMGGLDRPTGGQITVAGQDLGAMDNAALAAMRLHRIGFVFQSYSLIPVLTAEENVAFTLHLMGVDAAARRSRARELLAQVGLAGLEGRRPSRMSGGQQQRVAVARALATRPAIVLADEPTANLDSKTAEDLIHMMADLSRDSGVTFLISTHDARVIAHARRRIEMTDGRISHDARVEPQEA
jgi:putative ABC transport system ATP-binding protein